MAEHGRQPGGLVWVGASGMDCYYLRYQEPVADLGFALLCFNRKHSEFDEILTRMRRQRFVADARDGE